MATISPHAPPQTAHITNSPHLRIAFASGRSLMWVVRGQTPASVRIFSWLRCSAISKCPPETFARAACSRSQHYHFRMRRHATITHLPHGFVDANIIRVLIWIVNFLNIIDRGAANAWTRCDDQRSYSHVYLYFRIFIWLGLYLDEKEFLNCLRQNR